MRKALKLAVAILILTMPAALALDWALYSGGLDMVSCTSDNLGPASVYLAECNRKNQRYPQTPEEFYSFVAGFVVRIRPVSVGSSLIPLFPLLKNFSEKTPLPSTL